MLAPSKESLEKKSNLLVDMD
jgi:hypothetical protein